MNGDQMRRVKSGDRLVIPARTYNRVLDATEKVEGYQQGSGTLRSTAGLSATEVVVNNASGSALPRFAVIGIDGAGTLADGAINNEDSGRMLSQPWYLTGVSPTIRHYGGQWAILKDAAADGRTVRAFWKGLCTVPVFFQPNAANARYADLSYDTTLAFETLQAQFSGRARIISKDSSPISETDMAKLGLTAPKAGAFYFCVIDIGDPGPMEILVTPTASALISGETDRWEYEWDEVVMGAGYDYSAPAGLRTSTRLGVMVNPAESGNTTAGLQPDGVDTSALLGTFAKKPLGEGIVLRIHGPYFLGDESSSGDADPYWLSEPVANQYWGECEEPASSSSSGV